jgi:hypothetical protein
VTIALDLGICAITAGLPGGTTVAQAVVQAVAGPFSAGSGGDVVMSPRLVDATVAGVAAPATVQSEHLHRALEAVTGRQRGAPKVTRIGLLLAGEFQPRPDFFGLMFDEDFIPGTSNPWVSTPREGCAVFLSAIAARRSGADFIDEVVYTAIHELGHVLNLQHSVEPSYMARSASRAGPFPTSGRSFDSLQQRMLSQCSSSRFVWPGGSVFGDLGPFASVTNPLDAAASSAEPLLLRIGMQQDAFWQFEPVELDIELSLRGGGRAGMRVPDMVDPGYQRFTIWIEEPSGERRRYLSPRHYCDHAGRIAVTVSASKRRDVSLFGQSGGFCFQRAGLHKVFATFELSPRRVLHSNALEVMVRHPANSDYYVAARAAMTDRDLGQLLYYRALDRVRQRKLHRLADLCEAFPRQTAIANVHYALGRACARLANQRRQAGMPSQDLARQAATHLQAAMRKKALGDHRRAHAERVLEVLPTLAPAKARSEPV